MKKISKVLLWFGIAIVVVLDITLTIYLLNYNKYNVSVFGDKSLLVMNRKIDKFEKGDLLVVKKNENSEIKVEDNVFFYDTISKETIVNFGKVNVVNEKEGADSTFMMSNNYILSDENIIGKADTVKVYSGLGAIIGFLSSRWVFLIVIIVPILVLFIYELYLLVLEVKKSKK